jgi:hypothetical protein
MTNIFEKIEQVAVKVFEDVKGALVKAANEAPIIEATITKDLPEVAALAGVISPTLAAFVPNLAAVGSAVLSVLEQGGAAAEANFLNAGLDQTVINSAKALLPAAKALKAKA